MHRPTTSLHRSLRRIAGFALIGAGLVASFGCETERSYAEKQAKEAAKPRPDPVFVVRHHVGGTHHRCLAVGDVWYATFANSLLVLGAQRGVVLASIELQPFGTTGGATELLPVEGSDRLYVLLEGGAVVELSTADPRAPKVVDARHRREIGFAPRAISYADGRVWISGDGGVVAWSEVPARPDSAAAPQRGSQVSAPPAARLAEIAAERGPVGPVVASAEGLVAPAGRRVYRIDDGAFVGAASRLDAIPAYDAARIGLPGGLVFSLQGTSGARVGLMGPDVREIDSKAIPGIARRVRIVGDHLVAINDAEFIAFPILRTSESPDGQPFLGDPEFIPIRGARDIAQIGENRFAVVGSFGRSLYRWRADESGPADTFFEARREPSGLLYAATDRRRILAGGPQGSWLYRIGDEVSLVNQPIPQEDGRKRTAAGGWGTATVAPDARSVAIRPRGALAPPAEKNAPPLPLEVTYRPAVDGLVHGVESLGGRLWIWHDNGVDVLRADQSGVTPAGFFAIEGPVRYLFPQRVGGSVAYVSEFGGFGVLDFVDRDVLATVTGRRLTDLDGDGLEDVVLTEAEQARGRNDDDGRIPVPVGFDRFGDAPTSAR